MIKKNPSPQPLFSKRTKAEDIFTDREKAMERYRKRVNSAINGKKTEHA